MQVSKQYTSAIFNKDHIILSTGCDLAQYCIDRRSIISIERTRIYSMEWLAVALILMIIGAEFSMISMIVLGFFVGSFVNTSPFIKNLIRVPGAVYYSSGGVDEYKTMFDWYRSEDF